MKRVTRNTKQPARFTDMIPFESTSSENEPPFSRRRLNDSGSMKDNIQQLKSELASRSFLKRQKQNEHIRNILTSKQSLSQPLPKINSSSHYKFPLTKSVLHSNCSQTSHLSPNCTGQVDSHRNRSPTPHSSPDRTAHVDSHRNRSPTPHSSPDRTAHVDSHRNCSLTPHSSPDLAHADSHINRSSTLPFAQHQHKRQTTSYWSNRSTHSFFQTECMNNSDSHHNHTLTVLPQSNDPSSDSFLKNKKHLSYSSSQFIGRDKSLHDDKLIQNNLKTRVHKTMNNILPPLQSTTLSKKSPNNDDLFQIRSDIQNIIWQLQDLPKRITDQLGSTIRDKVRRVIKAALAQSVKVPCKLACLPLKTAKNIKKFDRLPSKEYDNVVRYLSHVGGWTARSCANAILKEAANDEVFHNFTFTGYKGKNVFKDLRFAKACEEAMAANHNFTLTQAVFKETITETLRSSKQRFRNRQNMVQIENNGGNSRDDSDETDNALSSENES